MKKILSLLLSAVLVCSMAVCSFSASAASITITAATEKDSYKPGATVAIPVLIKDNPGFWGLDFLVYFDNSTLQINSLTNGDLLLENEGWINVGKTANIDSYNNKGSYHYVGISNSLVKEITKDGTLFNVAFKIDEKAQKGTYEIKMQLGTGVVIDKDGNEIAPTFVNAKINVEGTIEDNPQPIVPTQSPTKVVAVTDAKGQPVPEVTSMMADANGKQQVVVLEYKTEVVENVVETGSPRDVVSSKAAAGAFDNEEDQVISQVENQANNGDNANGKDEKAPGSKSSGSMSTLLIVVIAIAVVIVVGLGVLLVVVNKRKGSVAAPADVQENTENENNDNN